MTTSGFHVGDTVRLKSGGPVMTITNLVDMGDDFAGWQAVCSWFDKNNVGHSQPYSVNALETSTPGPVIA